MADPTVEDWIRGYLHTYLPDTDGTEALVDQLTERMGLLGSRKLTDVQRESLEETFAGEARPLVEIIETVMDEELGHYPPDAPEQVAKSWLQTEAPDELQQTRIDVHTDLPPIYADHIQKKARGGLRSIL
jgi:hypothetical protein